MREYWSKMSLDVDHTHAVTGFGQAQSTSYPIPVLSGSLAQDWTPRIPQLSSHPSWGSCWLQVQYILLLIRRGVASPRALSLINHQDVSDVVSAVAADGRSQRPSWRWAALFACGRYFPIRVLRMSTNADFVISHCTRAIGLPKRHSRNRGGDET